MADRGQITGALLDGPLAFDNAVDKEAARIKGIKSAVAGQAQILVVPDLEAGNMLAKNLTFMAKADSAGIVLGARVPIVSDLACRFAPGPHGLVRDRGALRRRAAPRFNRCGSVNAMDTILVANAGSSSVKFQVFGIEPDGRSEAPDQGSDGRGWKPPATCASSRPQATCWSNELTRVERSVTSRSALATAGAWLRDELKINPVAIGHRVVHGGPDYDKPVRVDQNVLARLERYISLAPLHQPYNLAPIRSILARFPDLPQVACFDTAFHRGHGALADHYAIPEHLYAEGIRRYGFHGLSYEYIASIVPKVAPDRCIEAGDRRPSRQRRLHVRPQGRPQRREQHGVYGA